jgi:hypothetical protein
MDTDRVNQMLYSSAISIGAYGFYKFVQNLYHKYYLKSACHQQTLEISIVEREAEDKDKQTDNPDKSTQIELTIEKK